MVSSVKTDNKSSFIILKMSDFIVIIQIYTLTAANKSLFLLINFCLLKSTWIFFLGRCVLVFVLFFFFFR